MSNQTDGSMLVGVDEVGRGSLAGPVVAAAVVFSLQHRHIPGVRDSKQVPAAQREYLATAIMKDALYVGIGEVEAETIDASGIIQATALAMHLACGPESQPRTILVDGNLSFGLEKICTRCQPIIHGDQLVYSIAAASIVAKVYRDTLMKRLGACFPRYHWDRNKGYGTKEHRNAILRSGLTGYHRRSFVHRETL